MDEGEHPSTGTIIAPDSVVQKYRSLLEVTEAIVSDRDLPELFHDLALRLTGVLTFDFLFLVLHNPADETMRLHVWESSASRPLAVDEALQVDEAPSGWVLRTQQPLVVLDLDREPRWPKVARDIMWKNGMRSFCMVPLTLAGRPLGVLGLGSVRKEAYSSSDVEFIQELAKPVAVAVDNTLNFERAAALQKELVHERDRLRLILGVNNIVVSQLDLHKLFEAVSNCIRRRLGYEYASLSVYSAESGELRLHASDFENQGELVPDGTLLSLDGSVSGKVVASRRPLTLRFEDIEQYSSEPMRRLREAGIRSMCSVPLLAGDRLLGTLNAGSVRDGACDGAGLELLMQVANQLVIAVDNALAFRKIAELKDQLSKEKRYLEDEIRTEYDFEEIIGESAALRDVLEQVKVVAPTDSAVFIRGETGTGKELIARAIHNLSGRRERTFVKINCAAIPTGLLESELFGHEKGAFTGAIAQRIGRFELAHLGTLFLDEVGDIPLELQPKLLRVLQEQEFERLGSTRTIRVNVRIVAATNRDLTEMVALREFRNDLYYRLNVFPVLLPPLRERPADIPALIRFFVRRSAARMGKTIEDIPAATLAALSRYPWPGNVRELENLIERAVILSRGRTLQIPLAELEPSHRADTISNAVPDQPAESVATLEEAERAHILRALEQSKWIVGGAAGAAARLGMKRTTLQWKMRKLGISRPG
jgi:formate hydrogenlyase transcriptional activator